jgi:hypothetical protein
MSKYLHIKMQRALDEAKAQCADGLVNEGLNELKSKISDIESDGGYENFLEPVEHEPNYKGTELAEVAIDIYRSNINPKKGKEAYRSEEQPLTPARRHDMRAIARSLTGMRNGGDGGRLRQDAGPNGGDMRVGDGRVIHTEEKSVADMTIEEYEEYISGHYIVEEEEVILEEEPLLLQEEDGPVKDLEEKLLEMTDHSWQAIDKEMRIIAKEYDITPKELHKQFKSAHNGQIPDDWIKENVKIEECGWFPIEEAVLHKNGRPYDVTLIWRGHTRRLKFFWPKPSGASRDDMQRAAEMFYPGSRLITFYPTQEDETNFMVVVPPMTENYQITYEEEWVDMPWECVDLVNKIEDVEGKIISIPEISDQGIISFLISDNESGEHKMVYMGEDKHMSPEYKSAEKRAIKVINDNKKKTLRGIQVKVAEGAAWTKSEGQNKEGGLNEKGRKSYEKENPGSDLKAPTKEKGNPRRTSFCARMKGMRKRQKASNNTGDDRLSKSLRAWDC